MRAERPRQPGAACTSALPNWPSSSSLQLHSERSGASVSIRSMLGPSLGARQIPFEIDYPEPPVLLYGLSGGAPGAMRARCTNLDERGASMEMEPGAVWELPKASHAQARAATHRRRQARA